MSLNTNITNLQEILDKVNTLPSAENLEDELNSQSALISEQNTKIAELAQVLAGKAGSYENSGGSSTISVTIIDDACVNGGYYIDENNKVKRVVCTTKTVNALGGIVFARSPMETIVASGNYILSSESGVSMAVFLEDGGTATITT